VKQTLILLAGLMLGLALFAQEPGGPPPSGEGRPPAMPYDAAREVTLQGTVTAVQLGTRGPGTFVTLSFQSGSTTWEVLAGPESALKRAGLVLAQGDALTLVGVGQGSQFMARTLARGEVAVTLLDAQGRPSRP